MPDLKLASSLAFDRGIDSVVYARREDFSSLPQIQESAPTERVSQSQVDTILNMPSLNDALDEAIRPQLQNRELMSPKRFRQRLDSVCARLRDAAAGMESDGSAAERLRLINRATRLLNEECSLRDLVQMYRSVLYQG